MQFLTKWKCIAPPRRECCRFYGEIKHVGKVKVPVKQGILVGQECRLADAQYQSFLGVPYAVPPLGQLRFKSPVPLEKFDVPELDCSREGAMSYQKNVVTKLIEGSENCLFLNIYVPKCAQDERRAPLPVMVWIHGGGFAYGNANSDFHFPLQFMLEQVIIVSLNYRLDALGFLYLPEAGIYGNAGLKDQRLALQWVQDNIANFNGDPKNVTIFGESAGAASVHIHALGRDVNKLFHKVIMQSGTANMSWVFQRDPAYKSQRLAERLGFSGDTSNAHELLEFLQSKQVTPKHIRNVSMKVSTPDERRRDLPFRFKPVIEDDFSPDSIIDQPVYNVLTQPGCLAGMPILMGHNSAEGLAVLSYVLPEFKQFVKDLERFVPGDLLLNADEPEIARKIAAEIREFYFGGSKEITEAQLNELVALLGDYHFNTALFQGLELQLEYQHTSPHYFYQFDYNADGITYKKLFDLDYLRGACHGDELLYLFQSTDNLEPKSARDAKITQQLCQMWANFARNGNPSTQKCAWKPVNWTKANDESSSAHIDYLYIGNEIEMRRDPNAASVNFWKHLYANYSHVQSKL